MDIFGDGPSEAKIQADDEVEWEHKESQDGDLIGPCSTAKMIKVRDFLKSSLLTFLKLQSGDNSSLLVRRINTSNFYNIKRVDFDLYD